MEQGKCHKLLHKPYEAAICLLVAAFDRGDIGLDLFCSDGANSPLTWQPKWAQLISGPEKWNSKSLCALFPGTLEEG